MPPVKLSTKTGQASMGKKKKRLFFKNAASIKSTEKVISKEKIETSKPSKPLKNAARLPTKPEEASSNWKSLCNQIKTVPTKGRLLYLEKKKKEAESCLLAENSCKVETISQETSTSKNTSTETEIWFDGVDPILLDSTSSELTTHNEANETSKE